ncbi:hypothetical protein D3C78_657770 [compost metagenome]
MPGHFRAIQAAQAGCDIVEQQAGQQVAAGHPGQAAEQGQQTQLHRQRADQPAQAHAAGAQGAQQAAALLQGQADGGMHDEQADEEGQQTEGAEVEVEAVGQALQVVAGARRLQLQQLGQLGRQIRRPDCEIRRQQQPRQLPRRLQQRLGMADVDDDHPGRQLRVHLQGRQALAIAGQCPLAGLQAETLQGVRGDPGLSRHADKGAQVERAAGLPGHR